MAVLVKPGVEFGNELAPAGCRILDAIKRIAQEVDFDIVITSARDGVHSGPNDPHHSGEAYDLRTKTLQPAQKTLLVTLLRRELYQTPRRFYCFLEAAGGGNEHVHVQRRAGTTYSIYDYLSGA
jgi:hypothetical protein